MSEFEKRETRAVNRGFRINKSIDNAIRKIAEAEGVTYSHVANVLIEIGLQNVKANEVPDHG